MGSDERGLRGTEERRLTQHDAAQVHGVTDACISQRMRRGWTWSEAITTPSKRPNARGGKGRARGTGEVHQGRTVAEWAELTGLHVSTVRDRIARGKPLDAPRDRRGRKSSTEGGA